MSFVPGFDLTEAEELVAICTYLNFYPVVPTITPPPPPIPQSPVPGPLPTAWQLDEPEVEPIDHNAFQLGTRSSDGRRLVAFRGTIDKLGSILEDFDMVTIKADGFARDPRARIHQGFHVGLKSMLHGLKKGIGAWVDALGEGEILELYVTGHSQGAAVAALFGAWLKFGGWEPASRIDVKSYLFAQPRPGNTYFGYDYNLAYTNRGMSVDVVNSLDIVPQVPLTVQMPSDLNPRYKDLFNVVKLPKFLVKLFETKLPFTLDYRRVGSPMMLDGMPHPELFPDDYFFQHHAGRYWQLLLDGRF